jgi:hypothetical protein
MLSTLSSRHSIPIARSGAPCPSAPPGRAG